MIASVGSAGIVVSRREEEEEEEEEDGALSFSGWDVARSYTLVVLTVCVMAKLPYVHYDTTNDKRSGVVKVAEQCKRLIGSCKVH